jgi:ABC-2 type transport system ATP-binding protein
MSEMINVSNLGKRYGELEALTDISFSVDSGEVIGLLGPNGAGKTTLMKILTGYLHPSSGKATIGGLDVLAQTRKVQQLVGYLPENAPLYPELTVQAQLRMSAALRGIAERGRDQLISEAVHAVGLEDRLVRTIGTLSKGYRQRVGLAQAILHRPKLLILDEPTNGLDPTQIVEVRKLIRRLAEDATVLLSTHILPEVEATCDRAVIIMQGRLRADARLEELATSSTATLVLDQEEDVSAKLLDLPGVEEVSSLLEQNRSSYEITFNEEDLCPAVFNLAVKEGWPLHELRRDQHTLETVFNQLALEGEAA